MVDEIPMGNHSLTEIINLKQLHNLLNVKFAYLYFKGTSKGPEAL